jgi:hypothetical protein
MIEGMFLSLFALNQSKAQVGETICACQPTFYEFELDFALQCVDSNVKGTVGVKEAVCVLNTLGDENVTDRTPVEINSITILEVDQQAEVIGQSILTDLSLTSGNTFNYTSVLSTLSEQPSEETIPTGIQVFLRGRNAEDQLLVNFFAVVYDNNCSVTAEVSAGQQIGWTVFVSVNASAIALTIPVILFL